MTRGKAARPEAERFWPNVDTSGGPDACWPWLRGLNDGYGSFTAKVDGRFRTIGAHRWAFVNAGGVIPAGKQIHHTCNCRSCVNPAHLTTVTPKENIGAITERTSRRVIKFGHYAKAEGPKHTISFHCPEQIETLTRDAAYRLNCSLSYIICAALTQFFALDTTAASAREETA